MQTYGTATLLLIIITEKETPSQMVWSSWKERGPFHLSKDLDRMSLGGINLKQSAYVSAVDFDCLTYLGIVFSGSSLSPY